MNPIYPNDPTGRADPKAPVTLADVMEDPVAAGLLETMLAQNADLTRRVGTIEKHLRVFREAHRTLFAL